MRNKIKRAVSSMAYICFMPILMLVTILTIKKRDTLIWGTVPIINNKYWSSAMKEAGYKTVTIMGTYYNINKREDFDLYFTDLIPKLIWSKILRKRFGPIFAFYYVIRNGSVIHISFEGGPLGTTPIWRFEAFFYKISKIKVIVLPYGADAYIYSEVLDKSLQNGLLLSYPDNAKIEEKIKKKVVYWKKHADIIINGFIGLDGLGRWDVTTPQHVIINTSSWNIKNYYSGNNGINGIVKIIHTPNHRGFKGTEFIIDAVESLKSEGLNIELILMEKKPNDEVKLLMQDADILVEQIIAVSYALSALEGMASGLPTLSNLNNEAYTRVFRRYSFLDECPILSTTPENIKDNLRILITHPELRKELGQAGRKYVEKYHSYATAQYLFGSVYDKIIHGKDVDLMNLFHPLKSEYNRKLPYVMHPLVDNRLPNDYLTKKEFE